MLVRIEAGDKLPPARSQTVQFLVEFLNIQRSSAKKAFGKKLERSVFPLFQSDRSFL